MEGVFSLDVIAGVEMMLVALTALVATVMVLFKP
jgi:hypothetical protein